MHPYTTSLHKFLCDTNNNLKTLTAATYSNKFGFDYDTASSNPSKNAEMRNFSRIVVCTTKRKVAAFTKSRPKSS